MSDRFTELVNRVDDRFIRENIYRVSKTVLAKALKTADPTSRQKILRNMGESGAAEMEKRIADLGSIPLEEVEAAQREIISMAAPYI